MATSATRVDEGPGRKPLAASSGAASSTGGTTSRRPPNGPPTRGDAAAVKGQASADSVMRP